MEKLRILIADDHKILRDGLIIALSAEEDFMVVGEASNGFQTLQMVQEFAPDILLLDISMPIKSGLEVIEELAKTAPDQKIIVLTSYTEVNYLQKCLELGINGYIIKSAGLDEIVLAIRQVASGKNYISKQAKSTYFDDLNTFRKSEPANIILTKREKEILKYVTKGYTSHQTAEALFISPRTVDTHRSNLMKKLGVKNSIELINKSKELNLNS